MARFFHVAGPCNPADHYMLPPERRVSGVRQLIDEKLYFVIHAPRQVGKTTCFSTLARELTAEGKYAAVHLSCERAEAAGGHVERAVQAVLRAIETASERLPEPLRPRPIGEFREIESESRLSLYLRDWCHSSERPVVVFFDEIDALLDESLISVLRQLRDGYPERPDSFPHSIALIGLRDVRDYKAQIIANGESLGTSSPFNIKVRSLTIRNFTKDEVAELYLQHTEETGQKLEVEALELAWELTGGQPWLVNAVADQIIRDQLPADRTTVITKAHVEAAKEALIARRDTHLDSLLARLREARVRRIIEPILAGDLILGDTIDDDLSYVEDLGLIAPDPIGHARIANRIYQEVIPRAMAHAVQRTVPYETAWYVNEDGTLDMEGLLEAFQGFWRQHADALLGSQPYHEVAPHLVLMGFLQRIVNGGGTIDREYAVGMGRMDLCIRWPFPQGVQLEALELKVWRPGRPDPLKEGLGQLAGYLAKLELDHGVLVIFDRRETAPPPAERTSREELEYEGRRIVLLRL